MAMVSVSGMMLDMAIAKGMATNEDGPEALHLAEYNGQCERHPAQALHHDAMIAVVIGEHRECGRDEHAKEQRSRSDDCDLLRVEATPVKPHRQIRQMKPVEQEQRCINERETHGVGEPLGIRQSRGLSLVSSQRHGLGWLSLRPDGGAELSDEAVRCEPPQRAPRTERDLEKSKNRPGATGPVFQPSLTAPVIAAQLPP